MPTYPASKKDNDWFLQWYGAIFLIFFMGFANKKLGMGRDGFCQGIASISNMLITDNYLPTLVLGKVVS